MRIEKKIDIKRGSRELYDYLKLTRNQDNFSVWNMADPSMKKDYTGTDGTIGFIYGWDSTDKNVGAGEQEITGMDEGISISYEIRFLRPMHNTGKSQFILYPKESNLTTVSWIFDSPSKFPYSLFSPIFKIILGKDIKKGLLNLKALLEK